MTFDVSNPSRASETPSFTKFAVYGDMKFPVNDQTVPTVVFDKTEVEYKDNSWSYEGTRYWFPQHEHSFVAICPISVLAADNAPLYSNSQLSFTYTLPVSADNKVIKNEVADVVAATHRRLYSDKDHASTTVLKFGHAMTQINLSPALYDNIMTSDNFIEIHKMEFSGFKTKATFNVLPAPLQSNRQTDDRMLTVTGHAGDGTLAIEFATPVKLMNDSKNVSLLTDNDAIIMLPQTFGNDADARIVLYYTTDFDTSTLQQLTIPFANKSWEPGKSYTYRFTVSRKGLISESTTITDWEVLNAGNVNAH